MALRDDSRDVERLFAVLVEEAGATRARQPIQVSEIYQSIVPYRAFRARLAIDVSEDYEMAILRLLAGEGGYATVQPTEAGEQLAAEAAAINPDPTLVRDYAGALVTLDPARVGTVLSGAETYAPGLEDTSSHVPDGAPERTSSAEPDAMPDPVTPDADPEADSEPAPPDHKEPPSSARRPTTAKSAPVFALELEGATPHPVVGGRCRACGRGLPMHREVVFCPFCGKPAGERTCARCGEVVEPGWRFCVACGDVSSS